MLLFSSLCSSAASFGPGRGVPHNSHVARLHLFFSLTKVHAPHAQGPMIREEFEVVELVDC